MKRRALWFASGMIVAGLAACACKAKPATVTGGSGGASGPGSASGAAGDCAGVEAAVTALYQAEAKATGAADKDATFVADNVAMVVKDCARDPGHVASCAKAAGSVAQLEHDCLIPLDEDGTEGEKLAK